MSYGGWTEQQVHDALENWRSERNGLAKQVILLRGLLKDRTPFLSTVGDLKAEKNFLALRLVVSGCQMSRYTLPNVFTWGEVVQKVIEETRRAGQPLDQWGVHTASGERLFMHAYVGTEIGHEITAYISLKPGIGA